MDTDVSQLIAQAHESADRLDLQSAVTLCRRACDVDVTSVEALNALSDFCLQVLRRILPCHGVAH